MKTVNRGPQIFFFFRPWNYTLSKAHQLNISSAFKLLTPFLTLPLQILHTLPSPHTPSNTSEKQNRGRFWTSAVLSNKNMASMYETDSGVSVVDTCLRWKKSTEEETPLGPGWRCEHPQKTGEGGWGARGAGLTKKMRQTDHSWLWEIIISQHYKFLLDLCVCVRITDLLMDHKNRGWSFRLKKEKAAYKGKKHM